CVKTLEDIAVSYGYDGKKKEERVFMIKWLELKSGDVVGKKWIVKEVKSYDACEGKDEKMIWEMEGWGEVVYNYGDWFGWKKVFEVVGMGGILFGAVWKG
ncbi:EcsC family protein, partial [Bacillus sp. WP8]|uniref:EcsC family protein n=1 Tax=Bacillus sp. WP8 TaxID=756828 RepID=UPI0016432FDD